MSLVSRPQNIQTKLCSKDKNGSWKVFKRVGTTCLTNNSFLTKANWIAISHQQIEQTNHPQQSGFNYYPDNVCIGFINPFYGYLNFVIQSIAVFYVTLININTIISKYFRYYFWLPKSTICSSCVLLLVFKSSVSYRCK